MNVRFSATLKNCIASSLPITSSEMSPYHSMQSYMSLSFAEYTVLFEGIDEIKYTRS